MTAAMNSVSVRACEALRERATNADDPVDSEIHASDPSACVALRETSMDTADAAADVIADRPPIDPRR